jgi:proteasome-associated ATPase
MYLNDEIPISDAEILKYSGSVSETVEAMADATIASMYDDNTDNEFLEVTYQNGDKEILYYKDFSSGAMIENIVRRAKKTAIKRSLLDGSRGLTTDDLVAAVRQEFHENDDLPNTTNPDDWARISGKKGERIIFIRTLTQTSSDNGEPVGAKAIERTVSGQYL